MFSVIHVITMFSLVLCALCTAKVKRLFQPHYELHDVKLPSDVCMHYNIQRMHERMGKHYTRATNTRARVLTVQFWRRNLIVFAECQCFPVFQLFFPVISVFSMHPLAIFCSFVVTCDYVISCIPLCLCDLCGTCVSCVPYIYCDLIHSQE